MDSYSTHQGQLPSTEHIGYLLRTSPDWDYVSKLRDAWEGKLVIKGVTRPDDAKRLQKLGVDALWISNHAGRQFDAGPATIEALPHIRAATKLPLIFDSGVSNGLDILRARALGADFVMLGRAWHYALGALGADGPAHLADILSKDMAANMGQLGTKTLSELPARLV
jgi:L-lactate dehydrogenase (cytochrome)